MVTVRVKPCAVNSIRLVQWRKSRHRFSTDRRRSESASRDPAISPLSPEVFAMPRWPRRNLIASEGLFCTEGAQEMQKAEAAMFCDFGCRAEKGSVLHRTVDRDRTVEPKLGLSVSLSCLSPNWATEIKFPSSLRLFQDVRGTPTLSSVLVVRDLTANRCPLLRRQEPPRHHLYFDGPAENGQQKTNRRSLSVDPAHSRCACCIVSPWGFGKSRA